MIILVPVTQHNRQCHGFDIGVVFTTSEEEGSFQFYCSAVFGGAKG
jgi:hypothetical protein